MLHEFMGLAWIGLNFQHLMSHEPSRPEWQGTILRFLYDIQVREEGFGLGVRKIRFGEFCAMLRQSFLQVFRRVQSLCRVSQFWALPTFVPGDDSRCGAVRIFGLGVPFVAAAASRQVQEIGHVLLRNAVFVPAQYVCHRLSLL